MGAIHDRFKKKEQTGQLPSTGQARPFGYGGLRAQVVEERRETRRGPAPAEQDHLDIAHAYSKQKYIIANMPGMGEVALVFPNFLVHADMARAVFNRMEIVAAGFFRIMEGGVVSVYGRSESLNRDNRGQIDSNLIEMSLGIG
jgi:hypothetical protein